MSEELDIREAVKELCKQGRVGIIAHKLMFSEEKIYNLCVRLFASFPNLVLDWKDNQYIEKNIRYVVYRGNESKITAEDAQTIEDFFNKFFIESQDAELALKRLEGNKIYNFWKDDLNGCK